MDMNKMKQKQTVCILYIYEKGHSLLSRRRMIEQEHDACLIIGTEIIKREGLVGNKKLNSIVI